MYTSLTIFQTIQDCLYFIICAFFLILLVFLPSINLTFFVTIILNILRCYTDRETEKNRFIGLFYFVPFKIIFVHKISKQCIFAVNTVVFCVFILLGIIEIWHSFFWFILTTQCSILVVTRFNFITKTHRLLSTGTQV